ncbi:aldehyde dehydrogenase family protein [bacterium]|nr:aldehyde dehydrogenase family protein [bacterium]
MDKSNLIAAGKWLDTGRYLEVMNPYTLKPFTLLSKAGPEEITTSISGANAGFKKTKILTRHDRFQILSRITDLVAERHDNIVNTLVSEVGKTVREARAEVSRAQNTFRLSAQLALEFPGEVIPFDSAANGTPKWGFYERFPLGTVVAIIPFNFPFNLAAHKVGPAIAVGNPVIIKPSPKAPLSDILLGEIILDAGYPPEAVSVLPGEGGEVGEKLVSDPTVKVVTFTGSSAVGKRICKLGGLKKMVMELGSNSGVLVMDDANLERASDRVVAGAFALAGQVCISVQRVFVHEKVYDDFVSMVKSKTTRLVTGNPALENTDVGPMISELAALRLHEWIKSSSGEIICGGSHERSLFEPTIVLEPDADSVLLQEEAFGPVFSINKIKSLHEGLKKLNDSRFGLQAGIFTKNIHHARKAFESIEVGGVMVNEIPTFRVDIMPYGGVKDSGMDREGPRFAIEHMTYLKVFGVHRED